MTNAGDAGACRIVAPRLRSDSECPYNILLYCGYKYCTRQWTEWLKRVPGDPLGCRTGNGEELSSSQAEPGQAINSAVV